jgi:apolipoprotein N-acyltransferase
MPLLVPRRSRVKPALGVVLSAGLYALAFPPFGWSGLAWLALVPLVLALHGRTPRRAAGLAFAWAGLATLGVIAWLVPTLHGHFERPLLWSLGFWLGLGATTAAPFAAAALAGYAAAARSAPAALRPPLFAVAWVAFEYGRGELGLRSSWAALAHAQAGAPELLPLAAVAGAHGVSALLAWANAVVAEALASRLRGAPALVLPFALVLGLALAAGREPLEAPPAPLEVALVQGNVAAELRWRRSSAGEVLRRYGGITAELLRSAGGDRPALVVWPENAISTAPEDANTGALLRRLTASGAPLLFGGPRSELRGERRHHFNSAFLLHPDGRMEHYDKRWLLPFGETRPLGAGFGVDTPGDADVPEYTAGSRPGLFDVAGVRLGVLICVEALHPRLARELVTGGATVLVSLSNESWFGGAGGAEQQLQQAVFRAVENGVPLLRVTATGGTAVIAADGRVLQSLGAAQSGVLRANLPPRRPTSTFYARHGDWFAALCGVVWLLAAASASRPARAAQALLQRSSPRTAA